MTEKELREQKNTLMLSYAKRKIADYPLSLRWFKVYKWLLLLICLWNVFTFIYNIINFISVITKSESFDKLSEANKGLICTYNIFSLCSAIFIILILILLFKSFFTLDKKGYTLLKLHLFSAAVTGAIDSVFRCVIALETGGASDKAAMCFVAVVLCALCFIVEAVWVLINLIYFKKRKSLFLGEESTVKSAMEFQNKYKKMCPYCGKKTEKENTYCANCGRDI